MEPLNDRQTAYCVRAERAFSRALGGSCQIPLGAYAVTEGRDALRLRGFVSTRNGQEVVRGEVCGSTGDDEDLGRALAQSLRAQGAQEILDRLAAGQ